MWRYLDIKYFFMVACFKRPSPGDQALPDLLICFPRRLFWWFCCHFFVYNPPFLKVFGIFAMVISNSFAWLYLCPLYTEGLICRLRCVYLLGFISFTFSVNINTPSSCSEWHPAAVIGVKPSVSFDIPSCFEDQGNAR